MNKINKFSTFLGLYIAQSIPMSFFTTVIPVIMRQENYSLEAIGLLQFVKLPWIIKFLWAPLVDKNTKTLSQHKKWIISSELFYALIILCIGFLDLQTDFYIIIVLILIAIIASATQDIATDALAIKTWAKSERSLGNSIQSAGGFLGALVGSGILLLIYNSWGWLALLTGLAVFVLLALIPLCYFKHQLVEQSQTSQISFKDILLFFKQVGVSRHVIFLFISYSGLIGIMTMSKPYLVDNGYSMGQIGFVSGILGTGTAVLAAFVGGFVINKIGLKRSLVLFSLLSVLVGICFFQLTRNTYGQVHVNGAICFLWAVYGLTNVGVYVLSMNWAREGREGTDFTLQIVLAHLGSLIIAGLSGFVAQKIGYKGLFIIEIFLALSTFLFVQFIYTRKNYKLHS